MLSNNAKKYYSLFRQVGQAQCSNTSSPKHLICFKQWTACMVKDVIKSAKNLKSKHRNTHHKRLDTLANSKIMIFQEVNEPVLNMAVSKAATLLGAADVNITGDVLWDYDYYGCIFAFMTDAIFVSTNKHMCIQRFASKSKVPVLCMKSRTHATIQSLATVMAMEEEYGCLEGLNISWLGAAHPILNSYLLLCPMLGANIKFKCCCKAWNPDNNFAPQEFLEIFNDEEDSGSELEYLMSDEEFEDTIVDEDVAIPVSPLLLNSSEKMTETLGTVVKQCSSKSECLSNGCVFISGPTCKNKDKASEFQLTTKDITSSSPCEKWTYYHTCPRGAEVDDTIFYHCNSRTFTAFENMHYIAAALMAYCIKGFTF